MVVELSRAEPALAPDRGRESILLTPLSGALEREF